jgi:REase_DpnII-MboI
MDLTNPPTSYWHCLVEVPGQKNAAIVNDLTFQDLKRTVITPWHSGSPFAVSGTIVRSDQVTKIRIVHTQEPQDTFARRHDSSMRASGIADLATNRRSLPFSEGEDVTFVLLFEGKASPEPEPDVALVERICRRLPQAAKILAVRSRKGKSPFDIVDEYDVQDLLHGILRAYLKHSVQEDPLPKVAAAKGGRADVSIEALGVLIEVKYVHSPDDQKRIFEEFSQDLVLYAQWSHLRTLIYLIYNSGDLRDAEAFERLAGQQEVNGRRFDVRIVLS